jgi:hypothetical protein
MAEKSTSFARVPIQLLEDKRLTASGILVFTALSSYANNKTLQCYPSIETIASRAHLSRNAARNGLKELKRYEYIEVTHTRNGSRQGTNHYIIHFQSTNHERSQNVLSTQEYADSIEQKNETENLQSTFNERSKYERSPNVLLRVQQKDTNYTSITKQVLHASRSDKKKASLSLDQLEVEKLLKAECDHRGISWDKGKERKNLLALAMLKKNDVALLALAQHFIELTQAHSDFLSGKPPTASMLKAYLSTVEASMSEPQEDNTLPTTDHDFACPKCGAQILKGDTGCVRCGFLIADMEAAQ